jgi:hypothetical protein
MRRKFERWVARAIGVETPPPAGDWAAGAAGDFFLGFGIRVSATLRDNDVETITDREFTLEG